MNLERKGCCLAVREVNGRHTYDVLAKLLIEIKDEFSLKDKTCFTVTDSVSNFLKAFKHFAINTDEDEAFNETDADDSDDMNFIELDNILQSSHVSDDDAEEEVIYELLPHWKCACHCLNLIASSDCKKLKGTLKKISMQTYAKLYGMWNKQNRSSVAADNV